MDAAQQWIWDAYGRRARIPVRDNFCELLAKEGFLDGNHIVDVAAGPSPHVGYGLLAHLKPEQELSFIDWNYDSLEAHQEIYRQIKSSDYPQSNVREYWIEDDVQEQPHLITGRTVIIHGTIPRLSTETALIMPDTPELMIKTLDGILKADPAQLAFYLMSAEFNPMESRDAVLPALDKLGVRYQVHYVASADFTPHYGGCAILIDRKDAKPL
jgi:hypothetical protein